MPADSKPQMDGFGSCSLRDPSIFLVQTFARIDMQKEMLRDEVPINEAHEETERENTEQDDDRDNAPRRPDR
jgi:hypothetical protein